VTAFDAARFELGAGRKRPPYRPRAIRCEQCGAGIDIKDERAELVVCSHCGAHLKLSRAEVALLENVSSRPWSFPLRVGDSFRFEGIRYEVVARMAFIEDGDPAEVTRQYLLYHPCRGTWWLDEYDGDYSISRSTHLMPTTEADPEQMEPHDTIETHDGTRWVCQDSGCYELVYVDGALPWVARPGDRSAYAEFEERGGNRQYEIQRIANELEFGIGRSLSPAEVAEATRENERGARTQEPRERKGAGTKEARRKGTQKKEGARKKKDAGRRQAGRAAAPVDPTEDELKAKWMALDRQAQSYKLAIAVAVVCIGINMGFLDWSLDSGTKVVEEYISATTMAEQAMTWSFPVADPGNVILIQMSVPKEWPYVDLALFDTRNRVIHSARYQTFPSIPEVRDTGWEVDRFLSAYIWLPSAGKYRMKLGVPQSSRDGSALDLINFPVHISVHDGVLAPYAAVAGMLLGGTLFVVLLLGLRKVQWEKETF